MTQTILAGHVTHIDGAVALAVETVAADEDKWMVCKCGLHRQKDVVETGRPCTVCGRTDESES